MTHLPYRDPSLSPAERVDDLLARMTLPEKVGQMLQLNAMDDLTEIVVDRLAGSILHASPARVVEAIELARGTRLGIPLLVADDAIHGHGFFPGATVFPSQLGMAGTWDLDLVERAARATAVEAAATGLHWTFSPVLCLTRDLRWGRVNETFGEDPHLVGELGAAMVRGYQGEGLTDPTAVLATAKHFAGYSETQGGRDATEADLSPRKLRSWFLPPFERVVREGVRTVMIGYQAIDGVPITTSRWLLQGVLKDEWGFDGTLVTDWDNVGRMVWEQFVSPDHAHASAAAVDAGNDVIMATPTFFEGAQEAVADGRIDVARLDDAVRRILRLKVDLGLFEDPRAPVAERIEAVVGSAEHRDLALDVARGSLVLLENDGTLPLVSTGSTDGLRVAVVGPNADDPHAQLGDWAGASGQVSWIRDGHPRELTETVLDGLRAVAPSSWEVTYARGANIVELGPDPDGTHFPDGQPRPPAALPAPSDPVLLDEAEEAARAADVVVAVLGDEVALAGEGRSTATLELQGGQVELLERLVATGTPVVVVLVASKPLVLPDAARRAAALVHAANPGMRGGRAVAELLLGLIEPTGRLPISYALHAGQQPVFYHQVRGQHGTRYADLTQRPPYVFGEGLSYTSVEYSDLGLDAEDVARDGVVRGRVTVTNTGSRPAVETVQVYVSDKVTSVTWADRELTTFRRVPLAPGESVAVEVEVPAADCTIVDAGGRRVVEPGEFELLVGPSSRREDLLVAPFRIS
ncbi:glycoside hydrolase family 3 N-terminal domain-containing protein [Krasilnikoviella flava]|uniref:beta-glucosidase n=1 Tax=Krasilnikoviella flava TaxID=526729 RepID=A0A1T5JZC0_9MICO|nr:glycoside hydrolase family 3 N-terminal domain-containing protein [Krasilnikoviella flava]SKC56694.1 beta-glucosidase [Krasilnikoviella flava]